MSPLTPSTISLNDGHTIPQLGFGTAQMTAAETTEAVIRAIAAGYRHIDTAQMYGNERAVGEGIRSSGVPADDVFVTSKLDNDCHRPNDARASFDRTLERLEMDRVDLFLIHWPMPERYDGDYGTTWQTLEEFQRQGRARSIGVSNFEIAHLERLREVCEVVPAVNQIELHPGFQNRSVRAYCAEHEIVTEAWSPLGEGRALGHDEIRRIAQKLDRTPAQVVLRWHLQHGHVVFPKSSNPARIDENFSVFDFELTREDVAAIDALDRDERGRIGEHPDRMNDL